MRFQKAEPMPTRFKASMYGKPGSGKTLTSLLFAEGLVKEFGGRCAFIDTEFGTKFYDRAIKARDVHPEAFDFDRIITRSLSETLDAVTSLDPAEHSIVVIDSITHLYDAAKDAWLARNGHPEDIPIRAWGPIKRPFKALVSALLDMPINAIICGREKNLFEDQDGRLTNVGVAMRAEAETQFEPDFCFRMSPIGKSGSQQTVSMFVEKDRSGILEGRTYPNPTFDVLKPIISLLSKEQTAIEADEDERMAKDGELMDADQKKAEAKREKSVELFAEFQAGIAGAESMDDLATLQATIKKKKRYMIEEHLGALGQFFNAKRDSFAQKAGSI